MSLSYLASIYARAMRSKVIPPLVILLCFPVHLYFSALLPSNAICAIPPEPLQDSRSNHPNPKTVVENTVGIAKMHWQTSSDSIDSLNEQQMNSMATWRKLNPDHRYELLTNDNFDTFVTENYAQRPDVIFAFKAIKDPIVRSDFIRYLALYAHGGVYSDLDTIALKPVATWIPPAHAGQVNLVIGVEIDEPGDMHSDWIDNFQFCQSTMMARAGHGMLKILIAIIVDEIGSIVEERGNTTETMKFSFKDVLRIAGPTAFSTAVFRYLSLQEGRNVTRDDFVGINSAKIVGDVLVLTTNGFVPGQDHSRSGTPEDSTALVKHLFQGSWKSSHVLD